MPKTCWHYTRSFPYGDRWLPGHYLCSEEQKLSLREQDLSRVPEGACGRAGLESGLGSNPMAAFQRAQNSVKRLLSMGLVHEGS